MAIEVKVDRLTRSGIARELELGTADRGCCGGCVAGGLNDFAGGKSVEVEQPTRSVNGERVVAENCLSSGLLRRLDDALETGNSRSVVGHTGLEVSADSGLVGETEDGLKSSSRSNDRGNSVEGVVTSEHR